MKARLPSTAEKPSLFLGKMAEGNLKPPQDLRTV